MKPMILVAVLAALAAPVAMPAMAKPAGHCSPGLAKKNPPCVPPGLAKKGVTTSDYLRKGDRYDRDYERVYYPRRYRLPPLGENEGYYRDGRIVYRVDEQTRRVIELIRLTDLILND
ncbi:MAG: excinuclease ABC subunit A [Alphaproteobacteria bacterium]|nr:excinuclease ABC subunit A [Alphaproteobacteria bacterium]NNF72247.1 excinuclease ABC subunit A [Paracoccaceae bacterium]